MSFNRFQAVGNPGNFPQFPTSGNFPQFPTPGIGHRSWEPIQNSVGNIQHGVRNQSLNYSTNHLGQQSSYTMNTGINFMEMGPQACYNYRTTSSNNCGATTFRGPMPYLQNMPSSFCCPCPSYNATSCLVYPENQIVVILTPNGSWMQPMNALVGPACGPSIIRMDLGTEHQRGHPFLQDQPGVAHWQLLSINEAAATKQQIEEVRASLSYSQSSQNYHENLAHITVKPDEMQNPINQSLSTAAEDQTQQRAGIDSSGHSIEASFQLPEAGASSSGNQSANSMAGPRLEEWTELLGQDSRSTFDKQRMCCKFCQNNKDRTKIYRSHNMRDENGVTTCPYLRKVVCSCCKATGDNAHTLKYCPVNLRNRRMVEYRKRYLYRTMHNL